MNYNFVKVFSVAFLVGFGSPVLSKDAKRATDSKCLQTTPNLKYVGSLIGVSKKVDSVDQCAKICATYFDNFKKECKSANYYVSSKTCDIMDMVLDASDASMVKLYTQTNQDSTYIAVACSENGKPQPSVVPATLPPTGKPIPLGSCGRSAFDQRSNQRIVGGYEARPHSLPWIVSMSRYSGIHFCGGTLIRVSSKTESSDIFITAAHCVQDTSRTISALFGAHNSYRRENGTELIEVAKIVVHPEYRLGGQFNDIAILKLKTPVKFGPWIQPACLPAQAEIVPDGTTTIASGWGKSAENGSSLDLLSQVSFPVVNPQECINAFKKNGWPFLIKSEIMLCAGVPEGGVDTCQGDSGGPLITKGSNGYVLQGVVSFGQGCARVKSYGVYSRVSAYINWINEQVKSLSSISF